MKHLLLSPTLVRWHGNRTDFERRHVCEVLHEIALLSLTFTAFTPISYLDLWSGHQQRDVLVSLTGQQRYSILPVLDLYTIDLEGQKEILKQLILFLKRR